VRRLALVTGAGRGLGEAIARRLWAEGDHVAVLDADPLGAQRVAAEVHGTALVARTDDEDAVEAALDHLGDVPDVCVNSAGIVRFGSLLDHPLDDWRAVVDVNLTGTFVVARAVARRMVARGRGGCMVNITSMNGVAPGPNAGAYGATKAAVALLTQQMAIEWGPHHIRVNAVAPGLVDAGMSEPIYADAATRAAREAKVPLGRLGTAVDVAAVVAFLASDAAAYVTGQNVLVDGGVTMSMIANLPRPRSVDQVGHTDADA
jgi:NAD(P)-dependent dehydrogenase (short-subunit alcohol dehydrogenase family)